MFCSVRVRKTGNYYQKRSTLKILHQNYHVINKNLALIECKNILQSKLYGTEKLAAF